MPVSSRRSLLTAGAWGTPAVLLAGAAPAFAASPPRAVVHTLELPAGATLPLTVTHPQAGSFRISGAQRYVGSMRQQLGGLTSFTTYPYWALGGPALLLCQERTAITNIANTYGSRSYYTLTVTQVSGPPARDLTFTVGGVNVSTARNASGGYVAGGIDAIRSDHDRITVVTHGSGIYGVDERNGVPAHHTADAVGNDIYDARSFITFRLNGTLAPATFEMWNKATGDFVNGFNQDFYLGGLQVTSDV